MGRRFLRRLTEVTYETSTAGSMKKAAGSGFCRSTVQVRTVLSGNPAMGLVVGVLKSDKGVGTTSP